MKHSLALCLGKTIAELEAVMSWDEFLDWCAYYRLRPFGPEADDSRQAVMRATILSTVPRKPGRNLPSVDSLRLGNYRPRQMPWQAIRSNLLKVIGT